MCHQLRYMAARIYDLMYALALADLVSYAVSPLMNS